MGSFLLAGLILSQSAFSTQSSPPIGTSDGSIVVQGHDVTKSDIASTVLSIAQGSSSGGFIEQYARWGQPVCVSVAGLARDSGQMIADRIGSVARQVGIGAGGPGCSPNIFVIVTLDPQALIKRLDVHAPNLVSGASSRELVEVGRSHNAVRWITSTMLTSSKGDPAQPEGFKIKGYSLTAIPQWGSSNIQASTMTLTARVTIIVDARQIAEVTNSQLSGYLTMVSLAQLKIPTTTPAVETILTLFSNKQASPNDLTAFDIAYLKAVYSTNQALRADQQRMEIVNTVQNELGAALNH